MNTPDCSWTIEPAQLHDRAADGCSCIVDVSDAGLFAQGHIPGARLLPWQAIMYDAPPSPGLMPRAQQIDAVLAYLGHTSTTHYWVYDHEGGGWAGRFMWLLETIGHSHKTYINGGISAWQQAGLPLERGELTQATQRQEQPSPQPRSAHHHASVSAEELMLLLASDPPPIIWDARSEGEYSGRTRTAARNGHIPGAIHCEWTQLMDAGNGYCIRRDALEYLAGLGITAGRPVITHCQSHHRSGFTYLVGKALGLDIRAYAGSWSEWGNRPDTPITCE